MIIVVALMFADPLWEMIGDSTWLVMAPSLAGGLLAILAAIVFVIEYKGPYVGHA